MRHTLMKIPLLWALILCPACSFTVDDIFVDTRADDGGPDAPNSGGDGGQSTGDGSTGDGSTGLGYPDAGNGGGNTGTGTNGNTGGNTGGTTFGESTTGGPCTSDDGCGAEELCEPWQEEDWGYCQARCADDGTCRSIALKNELGPTVSDKGRVCFGTLPSTGPQGVPMEDASVYVWDLQHDPVELASALPSARALFIADDLCYFATDRGLMRVPLTGQAAAELIGAARGDKLKAWHTAKHIWWNHPVQGSHELWRLERTDGASPERFAAPAAAWETGNSKLVVRFSETQNEVIAAPLDNLAMEGVIGDSQAMQVFYGRSQLVIDEDYLYYGWIEFEGNLIRRLDLDNLSAPAQFMDSGYSSPVDHLHEFFFDDGLFFWAAQDVSKTYYRVLREPVDLSKPAVVVGKIANHSSLSLVSDFAVYRAQGEPRLTARPLAARDAPAP